MCGHARLLDEDDPEGLVGVYDERGNLQVVMARRVFEYFRSRGTMKTVSTIQAEHAAWVSKNFGESRGLRHPAMGIVEEVGELFHAVLKSEQGIRGTKEEHDAAIKDAIGDVCIYAIDYTSRLGMRLSDILRSESFDVTARIGDPLALALNAARQAYNAVAMDSEPQRKVVGAEAVDLVTMAMGALCTERGWSLHAIVSETWEAVAARDWAKNPRSGA